VASDLNALGGTEPRKHENTKTRKHEKTEPCVQRWTSDDFAGGIPLKRGGSVAGGIGVSGGSGKQDQQVAAAGAGAF
jgi:uncharacterized protein GlcG (DUF336 family)